MNVDASQSKIAIYTYAEGLFSRLAHDLALEAPISSGDVTGDTCTLHIAVRGIRVIGAVKKGNVDTRILSSADRDTIEAQIRGDVFHGADREILVTGVRDAREARIAIVAPTGRTDVVCAVETEGGTRAKGEVEVSMKAMGIAAVKGPLGAFRLADRVKVVFEIVAGG